MDIEFENKFYTTDKIMLIRFYLEILRRIFLVYILMFTNTNGIIVRYDSFTKGNFKEFIKENCKKAKIIVKNKGYIFGL